MVYIALEQVGRYLTMNTARSVGSKLLAFWHYKCMFQTSCVPYRYYL